MIRANDVTTRDDAVGEVTSAVHALPLHREVPLAVAPDDHRHTFDFNADDIAGLDLTQLRDGVPAHRYAFVQTASSQPPGSTK